MFDDRDPVIKIVTPTALIAVLALGLMGCKSIPSPDERLKLAHDWTAQARWVGKTIPTSSFQIQSWYPAQPAHAPHLTVFIEGDGLNWQSRTRLSPDPTPTIPVALGMALGHTQGVAAYLARPCQFTGADRPPCNRDAWSKDSYSLKAVQAMNQALDVIKTHFQAPSLTLVGYSGGAAMAALLTAGRNDVAYLISVAGNIDHQDFTHHHALTPLSGSLNPKDYRANLALIPQIHFVGTKDKIIPPVLVRRWAAPMPKAKVVEISAAEHGGIWVKLWPGLAAENPTAFVPAR